MVFFVHDGYKPTPGHVCLYIHTPSTMDPGAEFTVQLLEEYRRLPAASLSRRVPSPLIHACIVGDVRRVQKSLQRRTIDSTDALVVDSTHKGVSALFYALGDEPRRLDVVRLLLDAGARVDMALIKTAMLMNLKKAHVMLVWRAADLPSATTLASIQDASGGPRELFDILCPDSSLQAALAQRPNIPGLRFYEQTPGASVRLMRTSIKRSNLVRLLFTQQGAAYVPKSLRYTGKMLDGGAVEALLRDAGALHRLLGAYLRQVDPEADGWCTRDGVEYNIVLRDASMRAKMREVTDVDTVLARVSPLVESAVSARRTAPLMSFCNPRMLIDNQAATASMSLLESYSMQRMILLADTEDGLAPEANLLYKIGALARTMRAGQGTPERGMAPFETSMPDSPVHAGDTGPSAAAPLAPQKPPRGPSTSQSPPPLPYYAESPEMSDASSGVEDEWLADMLPSFGTDDLSPPAPRLTQSSGTAGRLGKLTM